MSGQGLQWTPSPFDVATEVRPDGTLLLRPLADLGPYPERVTDPLERWARECPARVFVARRGGDGEWQSLSYAETLLRVRRIAAGLLPLELSAERPLLILSGNSIEHLLLALAAMYLGVPYCPVSPAYCQASSDLSKARFVVDLLTPGLVAAFGDGNLGRAVQSIVPEQTPVVGDVAVATGHRILSLAELEAADPAAADAAHAATGPDSIAKFLMTSGSTGKPKAVITNHRMLCCNQVMLLQALPFVAAEPPVVVDWLPWNHTYGGSHNVGLVLFNGGTLYLDDGKPVPRLIDETFRNLREISPTVYFNVPKGFELLAAELGHDAQLRATFFRRLRACFFGGAALSQHTWDALTAAAVSERGSPIPVLSGLGSTECSPSVSFTTPANDRAGVIGLPAAGNWVKLAPAAGKLEMRVKGPNVTPGYWRMPEQTADAFDEEGFYRMGDAVRLLDPADPARGMVFDGRISEDFKLASGTWVSTGPLRASLLAALAPLAQDVVIAGLNRDYIGILIVPDLRACSRAAGVDGVADARQSLDQPQLRAQIVAALRAHAEKNPGSSTHARRAIVLTEPLSIDRGEITDKGSVNQRAVLDERSGLVEDLYSPQPPPYVLSTS